MIARPMLVTLGRAASGTAAGAAIGALQYALVDSAMKRADRAAGLSGLDVAAGAAIEYLLLTLVLMLAACWMLRMRLWAVVGLTIAVVQLLVVAFLFAHSSALGVHGHRRSIFFAVVAALVVGAANVCSRHRIADTVDA